MMEHVITFSSDGTGRCLWTEAVPLGELGRLSMNRASTVEFNTTTQQWEGWTRRVASDGTRSCKHTRYVDLGTAERHCKATHNYQRTERTHAKSNKSSYQIPRLGVRRFAV